MGRAVRGPEREPTCRVCVCSVRHTSTGESQPEHCFVETGPTTSLHIVGTVTRFPKGLELSFTTARTHDFSCVTPRASGAVSTMRSPVTVLLLVVVVIVTMVQHVSMESVVHPLAQQPTLGGGAKSGPIAGHRAFYTMFAPMLNNASEWPRAYNAYVYAPNLGVPLPHSDSIDVKIV
jgi:hypothetical protein